MATAPKRSAHRKDLGVLDELWPGHLAFQHRQRPGPRALRRLPTFTTDGHSALPSGDRGLYVSPAATPPDCRVLLIGEWMSQLVLAGRMPAGTESQSLTRFGSRYGDRRRLQADCASIYGNFYSLDRGAF
jgi:hypothetical protein